MRNRMHIQRPVALFVFICSTLLLVAHPAFAGQAKNIILMVSDGTGYNCFEAASYYQYGRLGQQAYDESGWIRLACRTTPLNRSDNPTGTVEQDKAIVYNTESAGGGSGVGV
ncbi:MAG TPA: hypothetical protein VHP11_07265, partial [Tepidisphaeraceae bacterium]|nr:hypothetical protein [Tepidisphaeraceae bacterium]